MRIMFLDSRVGCYNVVSVVWFRCLKNGLCMFRTSDGVHWFNEDVPDGKFVLWSTKLAEDGFVIIDDWFPFFRSDTLFDFFDRWEEY